MGKYQFKYLTEEMQKSLDAEIKKLGKDKVYENIEKNIETEFIAKLQNKPDAFKEVHKGPWHSTQWELEYFNTPRIYNLDSLEHEMLYYVDKDRFNNGGYKTK